MAAMRRAIRPAAQFGPFGVGGTSEGFVAPGWEMVREAFEHNFALGRELSAQLCVLRHGRTVVDLWGSCAPQPDGVGDAPGGAYGPDSVQCVFSSGKNIEAIAVAMLVDRGLLAYADPIARHWPEFGAHGKADVTVRARARARVRTRPLRARGSGRECASRSVARRVGGGRRARARVDSARAPSCALQAGLPTGGRRKGRDAFGKLLKMAGPRVVHPRAMWHWVRAPLVR